MVLPRQGRRGRGEPLRGPVADAAKAMDESRSIPTATCVRKLLSTPSTRAKGAERGAEGRVTKVSFTHLIASSIVKLLRNGR